MHSGKRFSRYALGFASVGLLAAAIGYASGPDVIVGSLHNLQHYTTGGPVTENGIGYRSYAVGTTSCNQGDVPLDWFQNSNQHPVIPQNMYRLKNGRIEQIGMSWLKHGFCALQQNVCGPCTPFGGSCEVKLGVGCSDPYDASLNGQQSNLGPRWQVNAATGGFAYPFDTQGMSGNSLYKRLRVAQDDLTGSLNPGALYFVEGMYVHPDDAASGNHANNASYRRITVNSSTYNLSFAGTTAREKPAIQAWRDHGGGADIVDPNVVLTAIDVPGDGRFWVGTKVTDNGNGTWHYQYAIENISSDRCGGSFSVPIPTGVTVSNVEFRDVDYHSGEPFDNTDWTKGVGSGVVSWTSPQPFAQNNNSNALRFATLYNFGFDADQPPTTATLTLGLFKPGTPSSMTFSGAAPAAPAPCPEDCSGDGSRDQADLALLLSCYESGPCCDIDGDGNTTQADLAALLASYEVPCP